MAETTLQMATEMRVGRYCIFDGKACIVKSIQTSKPGKHGHAKCRIEAVSIIDGSKIKIGDIVSYSYVDGTTIIHRVAQIGNDENGWYAVAKGDNSSFADPDKVRFSQIKRVVVAIVY